jgi:hypothetical protein
MLDYFYCIRIKIIMSPDAEPNLTNSEPQANIQELLIQPDMNFAEYATHLTAIQSDWDGFSKSPRQRPAVFIQTVKQEMEKVIDDLSPDDIGDAKDVLTTYGMHQDKLKPSHEALSWILKVRALAGLSSYIPGMGAQESNTNKNEKAYKVEAFWRDVYNASATEESVKVAQFSYLLGPSISDKDPAVLSEFNERLAHEPLVDVINGFSNNPQKLIRVTYDVFKSIVHEAADRGWNNAKVVNGLLEEIPLTDVPMHSVLIELGNKVTSILNHTNITPSGIKLDKLHIYQPEHMGEAINRCVFLMFELGKPGEDDPLNYMLTAQVLTKFCAEAAKQIRKD